MQHEATESVIVLQLFKYAAALRVAPAEALKIVLEEKIWRMSMQDQKTQSLGPVEKTEDMERAGAIPLICTLGAFQRKAVGPVCFIADASVTSKGT